MAEYAVVQRIQEGGDKFDGGKPAMDLVPPRALLQVGAVMAYGAQKYSAHNWRKGISVSRYLGAAMRHILAVVAGEDNDPESGLPHLAHAAACVLMAAETPKKYDDRWKETKDE